jgi:hypothetical protein
MEQGPAPRPTSLRSRSGRFRVEFFDAPGAEERHALRAVVLEPEVRLPAPGAVVGRAAALVADEPGRAVGLELVGHILNLCRDQADDKCLKWTRGA